MIAQLVHSFRNVFAVRHDPSTLLVGFVVFPVLQTKHTLIHPNMLNIGMMPHPLNRNIFPRLGMQRMFKNKQIPSTHLLLTQLHCIPKKDFALIQFFLTTHGNPSAFENFGED
jgi:hypothetical protein